MTEILRQLNSLKFLAKFLPASLISHSQRNLVVDSGMIRFQVGNAQYLYKKMVALHGTLYVIPHLNSKCTSVLNT
jgi:hypothetical protein